MLVHCSGGLVQGPQEPWLLRPQRPIDVTLILASVGLLALPTADPQDQGVSWLVKQVGGLRQSV